MYASVHHFLEKEEKSSLSHKYFSFKDSSGKYLNQTWWYHGFWRSKNTLNNVLKYTAQSMQNELIFCAKYVVENASSIEGEHDFKNYMSSIQDLCA